MGRAKPTPDEAHVAASRSLVPVRDQASAVIDSGFVALRGSCELRLACIPGQRPKILHWGTPLPTTSSAELDSMTFGQPPLGSSLVHLSGTLSNEAGTGISAPPGLIVQRQGTAWAIDLRVVECRQCEDHGIDIVCADERAAIEVIYRFVLTPGGEIIRSRTQVTNKGQSPLNVEWCAAPVLPIRREHTAIRGFAGRWSGEFQIEEVERFRGSYVRENRAGRTSHDFFPALLTLEPNTNETTGRAAAFHLAWSGNSRMRIDTLADGRAFLGAGELLLPGEIVLEKGESYASPELAFGHSDTGLNDLSARFHDHVMRDVISEPARSKQRPVHYNTWEAVYFDHDSAKLSRLVDLAAEAGAERFVLDDGWFGGRRNDRAGLGDWWVSPEVYPDGLRPLADKVHGKGMEFGLWFEPEMVNPDSDLYRKHPDWVLGVEGLDDVPFRSQLTLDLTKPEVSEYLFSSIAAVVEDNTVDYIKWDMNRDTAHPASGERGAMHRQTSAVYGLIDRLLERFPALEIESCASGGARADFGILQRTHRIWASDNNDALDRHAIQRGASHFLPPSVTGTHVGPRECHITGRVLDMRFRAGTAIFGHMGMELDLERETPPDREILAKAIALHKRHRALIHDGTFRRLDMQEPHEAVGSFARDGSEALVRCSMLTSAPTSLPGSLRITGLIPDRHYRLRLVWPGDPALPGGRSIVQEADLAGEGLVASGLALSEVGLQLPVMNPASCLIFHCLAED